MIRFDRGPEPDALRQLRPKQLDGLREILHQEGRDPLSTEITGYGHREVRDALYRVQSGKCCYCEDDIEPKHEDVEHFRPKAAANRMPGCTDKHGYWWLAFTWENLLYACPQCNEDSKGILFPLDAGSVALRAEEPGPGQERPLLLDPATEGGVKHIEFKRELIGQRWFWIPRPRNGSPRGDWTIRVCGLDREGLLVKYRKHVEAAVEVRADNLIKAISQGDKWTIYGEFQRTCLALLGPAQRFVGLSYDALVYYTGPQLEPWRLRWPMPE